MSPRLETISSYLRTRLVASPLVSRALFERWQRHQLAKWLRNRARKVRFYSGLPAALEALPVTDKATVMARFEDFNVARVTAQEAWHAIERDRRVGPFTVGASTGTSGNRGLFIISESERFAWLGAMLAKALPDFWRHKHRVAIILPSHTRLYEAANQTHQLELRFFDLTLGLEAWLGELTDFAPTVLVAPPKVLRVFADRSLPLRLSHVYSAAETLDPVDRPIIEAWCNVRLGEIYMATEGLLGVTCPHGTMHLAEDLLVFEFEPVPGDGGLVAPLITNFRRTTQIMARYRMNDLLKLYGERCPCGSPLRGVREIAGRMDDLFLFDALGGEVVITPDVMRNAVLASDRSITDFRIRQMDRDAVTLLLPDGTRPVALERAKQALSALFRNHGALVQLTAQTAEFALDVSQKLRRVENCVSRERGE